MLIYFVLKSYEIYSIRAFYNLYLTKFYTCSVNTAVNITFFSKMSPLMRIWVCFNLSLLSITKKAFLRFKCWKMGGK